MDPIQILAAAAAGVAACADADAGALQSLLLEWRGPEETCPALAAVPAAAAQGLGGLVRICSP
eukprot:1156785-Pelagomonas_calceolata.AAC.16